MGFSVSASAAIICVALFISFGMIYPTISNGFERTSDARAAEANQLLEQQNTAIALNSVTYYANDTVVVNVTNAGTSELDVDATDVLADNTYETNLTTTVGGDNATHLWLPGEYLRIAFSVTKKPSRVTIVTNHGVSAAGEVA